MKKLLTILCLVLLVSCSNEVPSHKLVIRQGIHYEINSTKPFTGIAVTYHDNGQVRAREEFKKGKLHGLWEEYYENGQLMKKARYKNGERETWLEFYHEDGTRGF